MVEMDSIRPESRIISDLGLDSMDYATVMLMTERWSGIKIREDGVDWSKIQTVDQLADLVVKHQKQ
jgi:acyl carrier protein